LRAKIVGIILEIRRRRTLEHQQAKLRKFREQREREGRGPSAATGDADDHALGLVGLGGKVAKDHTLRGASPRRTRLLDNLDDTELDMFRKDPRFFLESPALDADAGAPGGGKSATLKNADAEELADESVEELIEFFTPTRQEKDNNVSVPVFTRRLRVILAAQAAEIAAIESPEPQPRPVLDPSVAAMELQKMPCQGRRPAVRKDEASPTLRKVREVFNRKEEADAKWIEDRREALIRRVNINEFKSKEQQKETAALFSKQKELTKIRMLEAEERKAQADASAQDRWEGMDADFQRKMLVANNQAVDALEAKRAKATQTLDEWDHGMRRCEHYLRAQEREQVASAEQKWHGYMEKLWKHGDRKHNSEDSQAQKNDQLRTQIQESLMAQQREQQKNHARQIAEEVDAKLEAAAVRRRDNMRGARYNLIEKAFGAEAMGYDAKYHSYHTDRRGLVWKSSSEDWQKQRVTLGGGSPPSGSASSPALRRSR